MAKTATASFRFKPTDRIGAAGAEDDRDFLASCFVDTGALTLLGNMAETG